MIELPEFNEQSMYDAETNFNLMMSHERLAKFVIHWEAMKMVNEIPGCIVECGVFKGTSFSRFALIRDLLGSNFSARIIGFDVFSNNFPDTAYIQDKAQREHWINTAGSASIGKQQLEKILKDKGVNNFELVAGDATQTIPDFCKKNQGLKISLLNLDIDFVEPTVVALEHLYSRVMPGGVILLDNYAGFGSSGLSYHGDTRGIDEFFDGKNANIQRFPFAARPAFVIKK